MLNNFNVFSTFAAAAFFFVGSMVSAEMRYHRMPSIYYHQIYLLRDPTICVAVKDKVSGSNLVAAKCNDNDPKQRWHYTDLYLKNIYSGFCANSPGKWSMQQSPCIRHQRWNTWALYTDHKQVTLLENSNEELYPRRFASGWCMDVTSYSELIICRCEENNRNQEFGYRGPVNSYQTLLTKLDEMSKQQQNSQRKLKTQVIQFKVQLAETKRLLERTEKLQKGRMSMQKANAKDDTKRLNQQIATLQGQLRSCQAAL